MNNIHYLFISYYIIAYNLFVLQLLFTKAKPSIFKVRNIFISKGVTSLFRCYYSKNIGFSPLFDKSNFQLNPLKQSVDRVNLSFSKSYSTSTDKDYISKSLQRLDPSFIEWFVGFSDAEGSFDFLRKKSRNTYVFRFRISLHLDDIAVLNYIKDNLGIGRVSRDNNNCVFIVDKLLEIKPIIEIFKQRSLNTTKQLNFLSFKEAYLLYTNSEFNEELCYKLEHLRSGMNRKRTDFNLPNDHKYYITPNWLLGFTVKKKKYI